jgi:hypothetical protein
MLLLPSPFLIFPFSDAASLISSLESQLANSVSADAVELLKQEHLAELQGLGAQAAWVQGLETELMKTREAESSLRLEFDRRLTEEREILSAKHNSEVDGLRASLESKVANRDAKISELETLRAFDSKQHDDDLSAWRSWDSKQASPSKVLLSPTGLITLVSQLRETCCCAPHTFLLGFPIGCLNIAPSSGDDSTNYSSIIGTLQYTTLTKSDIAFLFNKVC